MKKFTTFTSIAQSVFFAAIVAQTGITQTNCPSPNGNGTISANNIQAAVSARGDMFNDNFDGAFRYKPQGVPAPSSIYTTGLWMIGTDLAGNTKMAASTYFVNNLDYQPGPLPEDGSAPSADNCANWNKVFTVTMAQILAFEAALPDILANPQIGIDQHPAVMGWPAKGNSFFAQVHGFDLPTTFGSLAPFLDNDGTALYDPLKGDRPGVELRDKPPFTPSAIAWSVFNDAKVHGLSGSTPVGIEVQLTAWQFDSTQAEGPFLNTVFTSHKMIYRGSESLENFRIGMFADFDLGCYLDDYIGCNPEKNYFYAYNQDPIDGQPGNSCSGTTTFAETPVQSGVMLNRTMDKFIYYNNTSVGSSQPSTTDPSTPIEFSNYLNGIWRDGTLLTTGGSGFDQGSSDTTNFAFPDNPADPTGWSMCTANLPFNDRRTVASTLVGTLLPGATKELHMAWVLHPNIPGPCNIAGVDDDIDIITTGYDNDFQGLVPISNPVLLTNAVLVSPNPAQTEVLLTYRGLNATNIRCYDMAGRLVYEQNNPIAEQQHISMAQWPAGTYAVQVLTDKGMETVRVVKQ